MTLFEAIKQGTEDDGILEEALQGIAAADLEAPDARGVTPIGYACELSAPTCVEKLLAAGAKLPPGFVASPDYTTLGDADAHESAIMRAFTYGFHQLAAALVAAGAPVDERDESQRSLLHHAGSQGWEDLAAQLLDHGVAIDVLDEDGETPLMTAALGGRLDVARFLRARGARNDLRNAHGLSIFDMVTRRRKQVLHACDLVEPKETDRRADAAAAIAPYLKMKVTAELDGGLFRHVPSTFWFMFLPFAEIKAELRENHEDETESWRWKDIVPVAAVSNEYNDRPFAWLFLDYRGGTPIVRAMQEGTLTGKAVSGLAALGLVVHGPDTEPRAWGDVDDDEGDDDDD